MLSVSKYAGPISMQTDRTNIRTTRAKSTAQSTQIWQKGAYWTKSEMILKFNVNLPFTETTLSSTVKQELA